MEEEVMPGLTAAPFNTSSSRMVLFIVMLSLICLCATAASVTGESRAVCPNPTVEVVEGGSVSLQCHLDPPDNVGNNAVDWKRTDTKKVVWSYRNEQENLRDQMAEFRGRVTVSREALSGGDMTLTISSVKTSDGGPYRCFTSKLWTSCGVSLIVVPRGQQNETKVEDFSTTTPPTHESNKPGPGNMRVHYISLPIVGVLFFFTVVSLVMRGMNHAKTKGGKDPTSA